jgi:hypothetical protein
MPFAHVTGSSRAECSRVTSRRPARCSHTVRRVPFSALTRPRPPKRPSSGRRGKELRLSSRSHLSSAQPRLAPARDRVPRLSLGDTERRGRHGLTSLIHPLDSANRFHTTFRGVNLLRIERLRGPPSHASPPRPTSTCRVSSPTRASSHHARSSDLAFALSPIRRWHPSRGSTFPTFAADSDPRVRSCVPAPGAPKIRHMAC